MIKDSTSFDFAKLLARFASSQLISTFLRLISGLLVVKLIDPETYGSFTGVGVYLGFILVGQGGIINGLSRELPYELGRGNSELSNEMASSVYVFSFLLSLIASSIFLFFGVFEILQGNSISAYIYFTYVILAAFHLINVQFLPTLYRTNNDFDSLAKQKIYIGLANLFSVLIIFFYGLYGLLIRAILLAFVEFGLLYLNKPFSLSFRYKIEYIKRLFKTGLPIFLVGMVNLLWITIVKGSIFKLGGPLNYGLYALSIIIENVFGVIPNSFAKVIYPKMAIMLGKGIPIPRIIKFSIKPLVKQFFIMLALATIGVYMLPIIVPIILPEYSEGILAAQWMLFFPVSQSFSSLNSIFNVLKKQKWYMISLLCGVLMGSLYMFLCIYIFGFSLEIFPQGLILGSFIQQSLSLFFIYKLFLK